MMAEMEEQGIGPILEFLEGKSDAAPRIEKIERSGLTFTDRVTIITGGAQGIGKACAEVFVDAGAKVTICDLDVEAGREVADALTQKGPGSCNFEKCDVSKPGNYEAFIDGVVKRTGILNCLINNAATHPPHGPIDAFTVEDLERLWQTNFVSHFVGCKRALPYLRQVKGSIVNMSSITAQLGEDGGAIYAATKGAISSFTKALAVGELRHGVRVNAVVPGNVYTESRRKGIEALGATGPEMDRWCDANQPIGRSGTPQEVAQACLFLASDAASFITGVELLVTAGVELSFGVKYPPVRY